MREWGMRGGEITGGKGTKGRKNKEISKNFNIRESEIGRKIIGKIVVG